ncbi:DHA2 family efflux MFS transporter permease subunit, partial [Tsukamurella soli]
MSTLTRELDSEPAEEAEETAAQRSHRLRWVVLGVLALAQLMVVLDATIVNIALPHAQSSLGFDNADRQWIVTAYALAFGSLLLLGGRLSDLVGRRTTLIIGLVGFAGMSALGGAAVNFDMLVTARAGQGLFGALLAPAALALLTTTFTDPSERARAFGIFGAIAGGGGALGLLLGGMLTEWADWRWCLYVNLAIAAIALVGAMLFLSDHKAEHRPRLDIPGVVTVSAALFSIVYGFSNAETNGWGNWATICWLVAGAVLLAAFVWLQAHTKHALLPLRVILDRTRGGSYLAVFIAGIGMFGIFLFLTYYLQQNLGFTPISTGLAFLPMIGVLIVGSTVATTVLLPRFGPRWMIAIGMLVAAGGMVLLTQLTDSSHYASDILPGLLVIGLGIGMSMAPSMQGAISGVSPEDAGVASATVNTMQQVGGSVGTALLSTIASSAATAWASSHARTTAPKQLAALAAVHSYTTAFWWAAAIFAIGGLLAGLVIRGGKLPTTAEAVDVPPTVNEGEEALAAAPTVSTPAVPTVSAPAAPVAEVTGPRSIEGRVLDLTGGAVPGATVAVTDATGIQVARAGVTGEGRYAIAALVSGVYTAIATAPGFGPQAQTVRVPEGHVVTRDFELESGTVLAGRVHTDDGPVPALLMVTDQTGVVVARSQAESDGSFRVLGLEPGTVAVTATAPGF